VSGNDNQSELIQAGTLNRMPTQLTCAEYARLETELEAETRKLTRASQALADQAETASRDEYTGLRADADEARIDWELARLILERHQMTHRGPRSS
jgi:hypothetical protein